MFGIENMMNDCMDRFLVMETMYNLEVSVINYEHGVLIEKMK